MDEVGGGGSSGGGGGGKSNSRAVEAGEKAGSELPLGSGEVVVTEHVLSQDMLFHSRGEGTRYWMESKCIERGEREREDFRLRTWES